MTDRTYQEKLNMISTLLIEAMVQRTIRIKRTTSQVEFNREMKISKGNFSAWLNKDRLPEGENIYKLGENQDIQAAARVLGYSIFDVMNVPPPATRDPYLRKIIEHLDTLPKDEAERITKQFLAELQSLDKKDELNSSTETA
jgi:hypothetical protein